MFNQSNTTCYLVKSNHGNHTGHNRTWELKAQGSESEMKKKLFDIALNCTDDHYAENGIVYDSMGREDYNNAMGYEYDMYYYYIIPENEIDDYRLRGDHYAGIFNLLEKFMKEEYLYINTAPISELDRHINNSEELTREEADELNLNEENEGSSYRWVKKEEFVDEPSEDNE